MKERSRLILIVALWAIGIFALGMATKCFGQAVDSSQVKLKTNGGLSGDTSNALTVTPYRGTSAPSSPATGQLWCDTTFSPCILKQYDGSAWTAPQVNAAIPTQTDTSSFPGSPVDGQLFFSKAPYGLFVYDATATKWVSFNLPVVTSGADIRDQYSNAVISPPTTPTVAASATAGSLSAGNYSYKMTCRNSQGGETTPSTVSATVAPGLNKSTDLTLALCGTGGTTRNLYRSKAGQDVTGPWWWVKSIGDNSTTSVNDGLADASAKCCAPDINFSGAPPGTWVGNTSSATNTGNGGVGTTSRGTMVCWGGPGNFTKAINTTSDAYVRCTLDISSYSAGSYTIQFRVRQLSNIGDSFQSICGPALAGIRQGTAANGITAIWQTSTYNCTFGTPISMNARPQNYYTERTTVGGNYPGATAANNTFPEIDSLPFWFRLVKRGSAINVFTSSDGINFSQWFTCTAANTTTASCSENYTVFGTSANDHFEFPMRSGDQLATYDSAHWIEIDNFTLTVN